ncbi:hypothetical protein CYY_004285 [Polysphondylium violaceum]|uniref:SH3 domain-containing protein n=1 Tax=Polysphondylium violaceum TaxID=133409 RepID=A0A8J4PX86_9MYCE|nr:hypothetical protein CYY_004285 [Polysphondylium violaceum]
MMSSYFEVIAIKEHKAIHQSQLAFKRGEKIVVIETAPTGWWRGEVNGKRGLFPQSYVTQSSPGSISPSLVSPNTLAQYNNTCQVLETITIENSTLSPPVLSPEPDDSTDSGSTSTNTPSESNSPFVRSTTASPVPQITMTSAKGATPVRGSTPVRDLIHPPIAQHPPPQHSDQLPPTPPNEKVTKPSTPPRVANLTISISSGNGNQDDPESLKYSPRFNITPSTMNMTVNPPKTHTRKNSGPATSIKEQPDTETDGMPNTNTKGAPFDKYSTLPTNTNRGVRTPLSTPGRISVKDINIEIPYYITRATNSYRKSTFDELDFVTGDLIVVYNSKNIEGDWWVGKIKSNFGIIPKSHVEIIKDISPNNNSNNNVNNNNNNISNNNSNSNSTQSTPPPSIPLQSTIITQQNIVNSLPPPSPAIQHPTTGTTYMKAVALTTYNSQFGNYLSLRKGDEMVLIKKEGEFWKARLGGQIGLVSPNFIKEIPVPSQHEYFQSIENPISSRNSSPSTNSPTHSRKNTSTPPPLNTTSNNNNITSPQPPPNSTYSPKSKTPITNNVTSSPIPHSNSSSDYFVNQAKQDHDHIQNSTSLNSSTSSLSSTNGGVVGGTSSLQNVDDDGIAQKIRDSFSHFATKEEMLEAIQNLAIKFVKQTAILKKDLLEERSQKSLLEKELFELKQKYSI